MQTTTAFPSITTESSSERQPIIIPIKSTVTNEVDISSGAKVEAAGRRIVNIFSRDPELPINKGSFDSEYSTSTVPPPIVVATTESSNRLFSPVRSEVSEPLANSEVRLSKTESENEDPVESLDENKATDIKKSQEKPRFFDRAALREKLRSVVLNAINEQDSSSIQEKVLLHISGSKGGDNGSNIQFLGVKCHQMPLTR